MNFFLKTAKKIIPKKIFNLFQPYYHYSLALLGALVYRFPSKNIRVIAVTGTKGKSSVVEMISSIFHDAGFKIASLSTIRFKIGDKNERNMFKMTTPGRFFVQKFLRDAVNAKCDFAILEMTSEGAKQYRHKFIELDALIFTNLQKEHIESHGSYEKYRDAKLKIAKSLGISHKNPKYIITNSDDSEAWRFISASNNAKPLGFSIKEAKDFSKEKNSIEFNLENIHFKSPLVGEFNVRNLLAAITTARAFGIKDEVITKSISKIEKIPGRAEILNTKSFDVVVDYAHTPDSLKAIYEAFPNKTKICVLGNTGGGRDVWKRPEMGMIADSYCKEVILTNEDPYDENPQKIIDDMKKGMTRNPKIIMNRRDAIKEACLMASKSQGNIVIITGKGTDPFIMEANGKKTPWDDATVAREEIEKLKLIQ